MERNRTKILVEISISVALAVILGMIKIYKMPQGGSISLEVLPIIVMAMKYGGPIGMLTGALTGILQLIVDPFIIHPMQVIMDYPLSFAMVGLAGFMNSKPILGICVSMISRLIIHVLSGVIFFASYAPEGMNPWVYSIGYNASFIVPETIILIIVIGILLRKGGSIFEERDE